MENSEFDRKRHWESVFGNKTAQQTSWYQKEPRLSLLMVVNAKLDRDAALIDVGGGASVLVDHLLGLGYRDLTVLDISRAALDQAIERLGDRAPQVNWIEADITSYIPDRKFDFWHDRAAFHFLTAKEDRLRYVQALRKALAPGGQAVIAAFPVARLGRPLPPALSASLRLRALVFAGLMSRGAAFRRRPSGYGAMPLRIRGAILLPRQGHTKLAGGASHRVLAWKEPVPRQGHRKPPPCRRPTP